MNSRDVGRLPRLVPSALDPNQSAVYEEITHGPRARAGQGLDLQESDGSLAGPFNAMLVAPGLGLHLQRLGAAIRYHTTLPATARELAILLCARAERSEFEWCAHEPIARAAGVSDAAIEEILAGETLSLNDPLDQAVGTVTKSLIEAGDVPDDLYRAASKVLTDVQLVELSVLVGYYRLLSVLLRTFRVPLPRNARSPFAREEGVEAPRV